MPKIEDLIGKKPKKMTENEETFFIGGAFSCQVCNKIVDEAEMDRASAVISWKCSEGHESKVSL